MGHELSYHRERCLTTLCSVGFGFEKGPRGFLDGLYEDGDRFESAFIVQQCKQ